MSKDNLGDRMKLLEGQAYDLPPLNKITNRVAVLFDDAAPEHKTES